MTDRELEIAEFLTRSGWSGATRSVMAGDASVRRYERITLPGNGDSAILMDAPVESCGNQAGFVVVTKYLRGLGLSAPCIIAQNTELGLLLLEDLGDGLFARILEMTPNIEARIYRVAVDLLVEIRNHSPSELPEYSPHLQAEVTLRSLDWYRLGVAGTKPSSELRVSLHDMVAELVDTIGGRAFFMHRDFHAENLIWLPGRSGLQRVGLLDYQDAKLAHPAYDLASLLEDARRDLSRGLHDEMLRHYADKTGTELRVLEREVAFSGMQRNLGILGLFARLAMRDGKAGYVGLIDRVWNHLAGNLSHPDLSELAGFVDRYIPKPTPAALTRIASWRL